MGTRALILKNFVVAQIVTLLVAAYVTFYTDFNLFRYGAPAQLIMLPAYCWVCYFHFREKKGFEIAFFIGAILLILSLFGIFNGELSLLVLGATYISFSHLAYAFLEPKSLLKHLNRRM